MGDFSIYIIKMAVMLAFLFSVYKLTVGRLKCPGLQRVLLLAIYSVSVLIPLIKPEWLHSASQEQIWNLDLTAFATGSNGDSITYSDSGIIADIVVGIMAGGSIIAAIISLAGLLWIVKCRLAGKSLTIGHIPVTVVSTPAISPFSFGGRIYLSKSDFESQNEMIIAHESSHIRHKHYIDLLIGRCVAITQWWNPLAWLMLREIHNVHEYQADNDVISQGHDMQEYQYLLLRKVAGPRFQHITDNFNHSKLKARLLMINRKNSIFPARLLSFLCIPAAIAGTMAVSSDLFADFTKPLAKAFEKVPGQIGIPSKIEDTSPNGSAHQISSHPILEINPEESDNTLTMTDTPDGSPDVLLNGVPFSYKDLDNIDPAKIKDISVIKDSDEHPNGLIVINMKETE